MDNKNTSGAPIGADVLAAWENFTRCLEQYAQQADMESAEDMAVYCIMQDGIARKGLERWQELKKASAKSARALPPRFIYFVREAQKRGFIFSINHWVFHGKEGLYYFLYKVCIADIGGEKKPTYQMARYFGVNHSSLKQGISAYKDCEKRINGTRLRPRQRWWQEIEDVISAVCEEMPCL